MCGRMNVSDSPFVKELMKALGITALPQVRNNVGPGSSANIVIQQDNERRLIEAIWSLLIEPKKDKPGFRPSPKWHTFNSKSTRLTSSPLWSSAFKSHRAIIPASCFFEWKDKVCYAIEPVDSAIAFAGLYRSWQFDDENVHSFSVITLPGQNNFKHIHDKSYPLILEAKDYEQWLDPKLKDTSVFKELLDSGIRKEISVTPVDSPKNMNKIGEKKLITAQAA
ncbi:MAG: SOS response-associated peptidase [Gammaproteobacteria bacterium]|jgi:putative SOS response-associated peptidase YedK|nr:SOS response-associated peptidase [Gammaproteobacteria bacterium]